MKMDLGALREAWKKLGRNRWLLLALAVGAALLLLSGSPGGGAKEEAADDAEDWADFSPAEEEARLRAILARVEGAGDVDVMLTLRSGPEQVLARDAETKEETGGGTARREESDTHVVLSGGSGSGERVVVCKRLSPEYRGALVVAEGAGDPAVDLALTRAVAAVTGLRWDEITVIKMKGS